MIDPIAMTSLAELSGNVGFGLVTIGAGLGIGLIGSKAAEATGRNPGASDRKSTRLNSSHKTESRMPSSA